MCSSRANIYPLLLVSWLYQSAGGNATKVRAFLGEAATLPSHLGHSPQTWFKGSQNIRQISGYRFGRIILYSNGSLYFKHVIKTDTACYFYVHSNRSAPCTRVQTCLDVIYKPTVLRMPALLTWLRGTAGQIDCPVDAYPPVSSFTWIRNNKAVKVGGNVQVFSTGTLKIKNAQLGDAGAYKCIPHNEVGSFHNSPRVLVQVKEAISFKTTPERVYTRFIGQSVMMHCQATGSLPIATWWVKLGDNLHNVTNRITITDRFLDIQDLQREDAGIYQCWANNSANTISATCYLKVQRTSTTKPAVTTTPKLAGLEDTETTGALVGGLVGGVVGLLVILGLACVIISLVTRKPRKEGPEKKDAHGF